MMRAALSLAPCPGCRCQMQGFSPAIGCLRLNGPYCARTMPALLPISVPLRLDCFQATMPTRPASYHGLTPIDSSSPVARREISTALPPPRRAGSNSDDDLESSSILWSHSVYLWHTDGLAQEIGNAVDLAVRQAAVICPRGVKAHQGSIDLNPEAPPIRAHPM